MNSEARQAQSIERMRVIVDPALADMRLDFFLLRVGLDLSRKKCRKLIDLGGVRVNGRRERIASRPVKAGDLLQIEFQRERLRSKPHQVSPLNKNQILYNEGGVIVVNKPPGVPSQPVADPQILDVAALVRQTISLEPSKVLRVLHRLDMETSGALVLAAEEDVANDIARQFKNREVEKRYLSIVYGLPENDYFERESFLSDIRPRIGLVEEVRSGGKASRTEFRTLARNEAIGVSLLQCTPLTGRTHQIRVHLAALGFPIVGDKRYGGGVEPLSEELSALALDHQMLHASSIQFVPKPKEAKPLRIRAAPPSSFLEFCRMANLVLPE